MPLAIFYFFMLFAVETNPNVPLLHEKVTIGRIALGINMIQEK